MKKIFALLMLFSIAMATDNTQSYTTHKVTEGNFPETFYRFTNTFSGATDSATFTLPFLTATQNDTVLWQINVGTISGNGDSVDISVRYEVSTDNSNWYSYTLGTDSTSWVSTTTGTTYKMAAPILIGAPAYGGYYPYVRIRTFGNTGNQTGGAGVYTKIRVDVFPR